NAEEYEEEKGKKGIGTLLNFGLREAKGLALIAPLMQFVMMLVIVAIIGYGGMRVASGAMSTGTLVAVLLYLFQIIMPITTSAMFFTQLQKAKGATERIINILNVPLETGQFGKDIDVSDQAIHVNNVSFQYDENEPILSHINFTAHPGEMIAFAGPSG